MVNKHCKLIYNAAENTRLNRQHHLHDYYTDRIYQPGFEATIKQENKKLSLDFNDL